MFNKLKETIGEENMSQNEADKAAYSSDASRIRGKADTIIWPKTLEDVRQAISYAKRHNLNVVPRGAGTGLAGGAVPQDSIVLDMCRMDRFAVQKDRAIVEPGVILDNLNSESDYILPVIPGSHAVCTIGGMIATNAAGMRAFKYGKMADWIDELHVIDGTGKMIKVQGEKINHFCGWEGSTGIVVRARLKLIKLPTLRTMTVLRFDSITPMVERLKGLDTSHVSALEYVDKYCSNLIGLGDMNHLIVEYESEEGEIKDEKELKKIWEKRDSLYAIISAKGYTVAEDPQVPLEHIDKLLYWLQKNDIPTFGHIGIGVIHPHFKKDTSQRLVEEMFTVVKKINGSVTGEHGVGLLKKPYLEDAYKKKIKELKETYDPSNVLNRGKII